MYYCSHKIPLQKLYIVSITRTPFITAKKIKKYRHHQTNGIQFFKISLLRNRNLTHNGNSSEIEMTMTWYHFKKFLKHKWYSHKDAIANHNVVLFAHKDLNAATKTAIFPYLIKPEAWLNWRNLVWVQSEKTIDITSITRYQNWLDKACAPCRSLKCLESFSSGRLHVHKGHLSTKGQLPLIQPFFLDKH